MTTENVNRAELAGAALLETNLEVARDRLGAEAYDALFAAASQHDPRTIKVQA